MDAIDNEDHRKGITPLCAAVLRGDLAQVKALLQAGADPNPATWYEPPVLVEAVRSGQVEMVQTLIAAGARVNVGFDELPLHIAAEEGHVAVARLLLASGAQVDGHQENYWTALMAAASAGHLPVVRLLVEHGADVNASSDGETPLMLAARGAHGEIYEFLYPLVSSELRAIADRDAQGIMARAQIRRSRAQDQRFQGLFEAAARGDLAQVERLIEQGVNVNGLAASGRSPLSVAVQGGKLPIMALLLEAGADPNLADETEDGQAANSPLMEAASTFFASNRKEMVTLLIQHGADLNQQDAGGKTALMNAMRDADGGVVDTLIQAGAQLDLEDQDGNTALMMALRSGATAVADLLMQAGASRKGLRELALLQAVEQGDLDGVKALLKERPDLDLRLGGTTVLCRAAAEGHRQMVALLLEVGADVNRRASEGYFNPLLYAAYGGHPEVVRALLAAGADAQVRVQDYLNALEYAELGKWEGNRAAENFEQVIALLERHGATHSG